MMNFCITTTEGYVFIVKATSMNEAAKEAIEKGYRPVSIVAL